MGTHTENHGSTILDATIKIMPAILVGLFVIIVMAHAGLSWAVIVVYITSPILHRYRIIRVASRFIQRKKYKFKVHLYHRLAFRRQQSEIHKISQRDSVYHASCLDRLGNPFYTR